MAKALLSVTTATILCCSCQTPPKPVTAETLNAAVGQMTPHYECILYHDQTGNKDGVAQSIDRAVTIGENYGLPPGEIMGIYSDIKKEQEQNVLDKAIEFASNREGAIPRISGEPIPPNAEEEKRAWEELYGSGCKSIQTKLPTSTKTKSIKYI